MAEQLPELPAAYRLIPLDAVPDLRQEARRLCEDGAEEGTLLWAKHQTNATGRLGKPWICGSGDLHCTIILRPDFEPERYPQILLVAAISLGNALATHLSPMISLSYGWPDDILIAGHKVASIWIDCDPDASEPWLSVTASVNILESPPDFSIPAISIRETEGTTEIDAPTLLATFARQFITSINTWSQDDGMAKLARQWYQRAQYREEDADIHTAVDTIHGRVRALEDDGNIRITCTDGGSRTVPLAELISNWSPNHE